MVATIGTTTYTIENDLTTKKKKKKSTIKTHSDVKGDMQRFFTKLMKK